MFPPVSQVRLFWDQRVNHSRGSPFDPVDVGAFEAGSGSSAVGVFFGSFPGANPTFLTNSQLVLINVETGERTYRSIGPLGRQRFGNLPSGVVHVVEVRTKRSIVQRDPFILAFPD